MKVLDLMSEKVTTLSPDDTIDRVFFLLNFEPIRHLPVVNKGKVVGMVSDRDLKKVLGSFNNRMFFTKNDEITVTIKSRKVRTIMRRGVITTSPNAEASEAASIMAQKKIGALPVVKYNQLIGIITTTDILRGFVQLSNKISPSKKKAAPRGIKPKK